MKRIVKLIFIFVLSFSLIGCQKKEKNVYTKTYTLTYFYLEDCGNCQNFTKNGLPLLEEEFGDHLQIIKYDMDDDKTIDEVREAYDKIVNEIIDFDQEDYGFGPFLVLDGYYAQLGVNNVDTYLENVINAINGKAIDSENGTIYYLKDGLVKGE